MLPRGRGPRIAAHHGTARGSGTRVGRRLFQPDRSDFLPLHRTENPEKRVGRAGTGRRARYDGLDPAEFCTTDHPFDTDQLISVAGIAQHVEHWVYNEKLDRQEIDGSLDKVEISDFKLDKDSVFRPEGTGEGNLTFDEVPAQIPQLFRQDPASGIPGPGSPLYLYRRLGGYRPYGRHGLRENGRGRNHRAHRNGPPGGTGRTDDALSDGMALPHGFELRGRVRTKYRDRHGRSGAGEPEHERRVRNLRTPGQREPHRLEGTSGPPRPLPRQLAGIPRAARDRAGQETDDQLRAESLHRQLAPLRSARTCTT